MIIRLGTRGSALARAQADLVADALAAHAWLGGLDADVEVVPITTDGDRMKGSLVGLSETGVFVTAIREALLRDECDVIVHSLKDMPVLPFEGVAVAAITERADQLDVICTDGRPWEDLPTGARVGTSSPRRIAQLRAMRPDLDLVEMRGNVDTRLAAIGDGYDAVVLAAAGLERLGRLREATYCFPVSDVVPAPGQGALAIEIREDAPQQIADLVAALDHSDTRCAVTAERAVLAAVMGGCAVPVGAYATVEDDQITLHARVINTAGTLMLNEHVCAPVREADAVGRGTGLTLLSRGASHLMRVP